ncbi:hypothetical protein DRF63_04080 [Actinobacillus pleuropneumoniae]|uniref:Uncharacterized protein n=1 Tax=Actinobacillus pleuropneumoniae TaxID=715 RepID=A0ABM6X319_ACTPL|nr:hypothetical protein APPSER1_04085 [Actinobacillus pleuropneumoniae serovar 1 str. 4074]AXA21248.1 hypothetical protein DRF63_04080 [Actinobacillus pleuropneumoniae]UKH30567.1 hypothetical protein D1104_04130 [Actinobacillus pleuropneumoniae serovar 11 str. 56153]UKH34713.1 hypothetical protein D1102_04100 [Actinobacillus pleuropneumoniae serovar 9 str. CVJ13261]UKH45472.1 hypothetical protein D1095_03795 [Actinobacillus pleuropneumoniae serovar 2 str. S1536]
MFHFVRLKKDIRQTVYPPKYEVFRLAENHLFGNSSLYIFIIFLSISIHIKSLITKNQIKTFLNQSLSGRILVDFNHNTIRDLNETGK